MLGSGLKGRSFDDSKLLRPPRRFPWCLGPIAVARHALVRLASILSCEGHAVRKRHKTAEVTCAPPRPAFVVRRARQPSTLSLSSWRVTLGQAVATVVQSVSASEHDLLAATTYYGANAQDEGLIDTVGINHSTRMRVAGAPVPRPALQEANPKDIDHPSWASTSWRMSGYEPLSGQMMSTAHGTWFEICQATSDVLVIEGWNVAPADAHRWIERREIEFKVCI